ncbi:MAG: glycosyltransferase family 4 protein [Acidobacteriota bacterium]
MRVLLASDHFPPRAPGGAEWSIEALAELLAPRLERLVVAVVADGVEEKERRGALEVVRFRGPRLMGGENGRSRAWVMANPWFTLRTAARLRRLARRTRVDLVHAQSHGVLPAACLAAGSLGLPIVATLRDTRTLCEPAVCLHRRARVPDDCGHTKLLSACVDEFLDLAGAPPGRLRRLRQKGIFSWLWIDNRWRWWCLRRCDAVVSVSAGLLEVYRSRGLLDARRSQLRVVPTVPPARPPDAEARRRRTRERLDLDGRPVALYLGKHSPGKGTPCLRRAWEEVFRRLPRALLLLAGDSHPDPGQPGVRILGSVPHEEALDLILAADLIVSPSVGPEALARALVEAAGLGTPVIGTRSGGTPEIVRDGENGLLVDRGDAAALAAALERMLADKALRERFAASQRRLSTSTLSSDSIGEAHLDLYRSLCAGLRSKAAP